MNLPVVHAAERDRKLVADLATERAGLHESKVVRVRRLPAADKAGLQGDELEMRFIAIPSRFANRKDALVDATTEAAAPTLNLAAFGQAGRLGRSGAVQSPARDGLTFCNTREKLPCT